MNRVLLSTLTLLLTVASAAYGQGTQFSYQGRLTDSGSPADGLFDMQFKLFDTQTVGTGIQHGLANLTVQVSEGTFTVQLDFGAGAFDGSARFLEIGLRPAGSPNPYTILAPRQPVTATPYAIRTAIANVATNAMQLQGVSSSGFIQNTTSQQASTNFNISGNGTVGGLLSGNAVNAATQFNLAGSRVLSADGANNMFVGPSAGTTNTTGTFNAFFGELAGASNTTAASNSFFGASAGLSNTTATDNSFFGRDAGFQSNGNFNSFFGSSAGRNSTTGLQNSFFGAFAGFLNGTAGDNSFFGFEAGLNNSASFNSFFGSLAGLNNTSGAENAFFGASAGKANTTGFHNAFFGSGSGFSNTTGRENAFFGYHAGLSNQTGKDNSFFGASAGQNNTADSNSFFGFFAGLVNTTGSFNSFFGASAGSSNSTGFNNDFFGSSAGGSNTSGNGNSFFGSSAGLNNTTGTGNTFVGRSSGLSNTVENFNTFVGFQSNGAAGITNATAIGAGATVMQSNSLVLGNGVNVGINTTAPKTRLDVVASASQIRFGSSLFDQGGFLTSIDATQADLSGGAKWNGFNWIATGPTASLVELVSGDVTFSTASGLISGNPFSFTEQMRITSAGRVGIGAAFPADKLEVAGDIRIGTGGNGCVRSSNSTIIAGACSSDARFKRSITPFPNTLGRLVRLQPVHFYWRAGEYPEKHFGTDRSFGLVAQDVEKEMPELVAEDERGFKLVHYHKLPLLILQAIKELKAEKDAEIASLKSEYTELKKQNADLESRLRALEKKLK